METRPLCYYAHELRRSLPERAFAPVPRRLVWLALHALLIAGATFVCARRWGGWPGTLAATLVIGHSFGTLALVAHEILHGAVVREGRARMLLGWIAFLPFCISPRLWVAWHNRVHHGHTGLTGTDPDTYARLADYQRSRAIRVVDRLSIGSSRVGGLVTWLLGFTGQSLSILIGGAQLGLSRRVRQIAALETLLGFSLWALLGAALGAHVFVFAFALPLMLGNALVMSYILTNHSLSPLTEVNDPLLNTLSVTGPRLVEIVHLNFGYHVEHHIFPAMSSCHLPLVRPMVRQRFGERYQSMPLHRALWRLFRTPRIYKDDVTLLDPRSGLEAATLLPRA